MSSETCGARFDTIQFKYVLKCVTMLAKKTEVLKKGGGGVRVRILGQLNI
jgi:hypothetical protein